MMHAYGAGFGTVKCLSLCTALMLAGCQGSPGTSMEKPTPSAGQTETKSGTHSFEDRTARTNSDGASEVNSGQAKSASSAKDKKAAEKPKKKPKPGASSAVNWLTDYPAARQLARQTGKPIFVVFR
jgi:hypothetical protein